jgi:predicted CXXCH cytochrome family protein
MAGPSRYSTKIRAKRIALQYFKRLHPFRRWKLILSIAAPVLAALWIVVAASRGDQRLYLGGPVSTAHAMFESECRLCHGPAPTTPVTQASLAAAAAATPSGFFLKVADASCTTCHAGPAHAARETFTPPCASCHIEHLGRAVLVQIADRHCVQCHGNLEIKGGQPSPYHRTIPALAQHPEFAVDVKDAGTVARVRLDKPAELHDTARMKLNHVKHLKTNLKGVEELEKAFGEAAVVKLEGGAQIACTFCHRPDERGQYLQPIAYAQHCAACHPLDFDGRFPDAVVPHDTPPIVRAFLRGTLSEAFDQCQTIPDGEAGAPIHERCVALDLAKAPPTPAAEGDRPRGRRRGGGAEAPPADEPRGGRLRGRAPESEPAPAPEPDTPRGGRLRRGGDEEAGDAPRGRRAGRGEPPTPASWVAGQMATLEPSVFKQRCEYCHTVTREADALPQIVSTAITARWLPHARFDHRAHRPVACGECHKAATSTETRDVLLPSIATCRECHKPQAGARTGCVECHRYHDKSQERSPDGPLKIHQLLDRTGAADRDRVR